MQLTRSHYYLILGVGIFGATFGAPFIRVTQEAGLPTVVIVVGRLTIVSLLYTPIAIKRGAMPQLQALTPSDWGFTLFSGVFLATHFLTFINSLEFTSVMGTLVFNSLSPLFVALIASVFFGETIRRAVIFGIVLAIAGTVLYAFGGNDGANPPTRDAPLLGNSLAAMGALSLALYFTLGSRVRGKLDNLTYSWIVFVFAALTSWLALPFYGIGLWGYPLMAYFWLLMVVLFAQILAHSSWNFALGGLSSTIVATTQFVIPVTASISSIFLVGELPSSWMSVVGSIVIASWRGAC